MEWFLVLIIQTGVGQGTYRYTNEKPMAFAECAEAAKTFKPMVPTGGDTEVSLAVVCSKGKLNLEK